MRDYSKISPKFWSETVQKEMKSLGSDIIVIAFYIQTCKHASMIGVYHLPLAYVSHDTGINEEKIILSLQYLEKTAFCTYDMESEYIWVHDMAFDQIGDQLDAKDKRVRGINTLFHSLPALPFLKNFYNQYQDHFHLTSHSSFEKKNIKFVEEGSIKKNNLEISPYEAPCEPLQSQEQDHKSEHKEQVDEKVLKQDPGLSLQEIQLGIDHPPHEMDSIPLGRVSIEERTLEMGPLEPFEGALKPLASPFEGPCKPLRSQEQEQEQEQQQKQKQEHQQEQEEVRHRRVLRHRQEAVLEKTEVPSPQGVPPSFFVIEIPLCDGSGFSVSQAMIDEWQWLYQGVNVLQQLKNIRDWNVTHPDKRKSDLTVLQYINQWLANENTSVLKPLPNSLATPSKSFPNQEAGKHREILGQRQDLVLEKTEVPSPKGVSPLFFVIEIPLRDEGEFAVSQAMIDEWQQLYPSVNILQALKNIRGWNLANPSKRKSGHFILQHINHWLATENAYQAKNPVREKPEGFDLAAHNAQVAKAWLQSESFGYEVLDERK